MYVPLKTFNPKEQKEDKKKNKKPKAPKKPERVSVFSVKTTDDNIQSTKQGYKPENQVALLKSLMGVRIYMRNPVISKIFNDQQDRMGKMLGRLDSQLSKHPKVLKEEDDTTDPAEPSDSTDPADPADSTDPAGPDATLPTRPKKDDPKVKRGDETTTGKGKEPVKDENKAPFAWEKMGLEELWGEFMDLRFNTAVERMNSDMEYGIKELKAVAIKTKNTELEASVKVLDEQWTKEKANDWKMPWTAHKKADAIIPTGVSDNETL